MKKATIEENQLVHAMKYEYDIEEVTTDRQRKNGTRIFSIPVMNHYHARGEKRIQLGTYSSGYVRNVSSGTTPYQLNKKYKRKYMTTTLLVGKLVDLPFDKYSRSMIWNQMARLLYMLEYAKRNYNLKPRADADRL